VKLAGALMFAALTACSAAPATSRQPGGLGPAEHGEDASAAIAEARACVEHNQAWSMNGGFGARVDEATAHRDPSDGSRWIVMFPAGHYMGRLPPPGPGTALLIAVTPPKGSPCKAVPSSPPAR
jgi:hypothetical protein